MRKLIFITIIFILCFGCVSNDEPFDTIHVTLFISDLENPFFMSLKEHAELACKEKGYQLSVFDSRNNTKREFDHFKRLIHSDMILLNPVDSEISSQIVEEANKIGVPVMTIDRNVKSGYVISHITSDNYYGGLLAGELIEMVHRDDEKVLLIEGTENSKTSLNRIKGVKDYLNNRNIPINHTIRGDFKRSSTRAKYATLDEHYDIVFAANDEMALGVLDASIKADKHIAIIGFDGTDEAISSVIDGYLVGTINQQPDLMAKYALDLTEKYYNGDEVEEQVMVKLKTITMIVR